MVIKSVYVNWFNSNNFFDGSILDTLGCRVKPTFYVTSQGTDYGYVNLLSKFGIFLFFLFLFLLYFFVVSIKMMLKKFNILICRFNLRSQRSP